MITETITHFCRPIAALAFAGSTYVATSVPPTAVSLPEWINALGLPVAFLVAVIYALVATNRALRRSEDGRREDWKSHSAKLEEIMHEGNASRERLIRATDLQTQEFRHLAEQLKSR
jgi:hypothetical protein